MSYHDEAPLWEQIKECLNMLDTALLECKKRGREWVFAECEYHDVKADTAIALKEAGNPVTFIQTIIKGCKEVIPAYRKALLAQVEYENAREARNIWKKKLDTLREQYSREWSQAGLE